MKGNGTPPIGLRTLDYLVKRIRGQHSDFFRTSVFYGTKKFLLAEIKRHKQLSPKPLRAAIVGCAAGEEVYSLAVALHNDRLLKDVSFRAVDNDPNMVVYAARGTYRFDDYEGRLDFFEDVPDACRAYFIVHPDQEGIFSVDPRIRKAIAFQLADVAAADFTTKVPEQDVFIINNVLVHMDEQRKAAVAGNLIGRLVSGGKVIVNEAIDSPALRFVRKEGDIYLYEKVS